MKKDNRSFLILGAGVLTTALTGAVYSAEARTTDLVQTGEDKVVRGSLIDEAKAALESAALGLPVDGTRSLGGRRIRGQWRLILGASGQPSVFTFAQGARGLQGGSKGIVNAPKAPAVNVKPPPPPPPPHIK